MNIQRWTAAPAALALGALLLLGGCGAAAAEEPYYCPALQLTGDVPQVVSFYRDPAGYWADCGEGSVETEVSGDAERITEDGTARAMSLADMLQLSGICAEESHMYFAGYDGMMACADAALAEDIYVHFGKNGWEITGDDLPPSIGVKGAERIILVADHPEQVDSAVSVTDENGYTRWISPGTLWIMESSAQLHFHGESQISGRQVSVYTTDSWSTMGASRLINHGNSIEVVEEGYAGS